MASKPSGPGTESTTDADLNYLGADYLYEVTIGETLIDPAKVTADAKKVINSKWDEIMTGEQPAVKKENPSDGQAGGSDNPRPHPRERAVPAKRAPAKRTKAKPKDSADEREERIRAEEEDH